MFGFKQYLPFITEQTKARGIQHLPHAAEHAFGKEVSKGQYKHGSDVILSTLNTLQNATSSRSKITRKIDDRMSFQVKKDKSGKVGVKYKGPGAEYNYSASDVEKQHGHKPYLAGPIKTILQHVGKVLPNKAGEWQGGYLSSPSDRAEEDGHITHTPNTIKYSVKKDSPEGKKLAGSKVSIVLHSKLSASGSASPADRSEFKDHPDVHVMDHTVTSEEKSIPEKDKRKALEHIGAAKKLLKGHTFEHLPGHEETLRRYTNSTIDTGEKPSTKGYAKFIEKYHDKRIESVKTEKAKAQKQQEKQAAINHINDNLEKFDRSFDLHHHMQQATYAVADGLSKTAHGGYKHSISGQEAAGEGFVTKGVKLVPRKFTMANRARSAELKAKKNVKSVI